MSIKQAPAAIKLGRVTHPCCGWFQMPLIRFNLMGNCMSSERQILKAAPGAGFSLIEVMVVVVILMILMGMLFPVVIGALTWSREKRAMIEVKNIEMAIKEYRAVYGRWPNQTQAASDTCYYAANGPVIDPLTNNPRQMVFLQLQQSSISNGSFLDPWLHPYVIVMDENGDNRVTFAVTNVVLTNLSGRVTTNSLWFSIEASVGVVSWGKLDANLSGGGGGMDLCSWQSGAKTK